jgi:REP element-mobilizing transposase RayT
MNYKSSCTYHFITKPNNRKKTPKIHSEIKVMLCEQ